MTSYKRRNYFIDKKFQTKYILLTLLLLITYTLLFVAILFIPHLISVASDLPVAEQTQSAKTLLLLHAKVWPALGIVIAIMSVLSVFISHKVAGPAYRIKKTLSEIAKGDLSRSIKLRDGDDLQDVAVHINALLDELRGFVSTLSKDSELLTEYINDLEEQIASKTISETSGKEMIERFKERRQSIKNALDRFNTSN
jgi:methyl-accepting chemotaxis protein